MDKGYAKTHIIDYDETFALVIKMIMVHAILVVASTKMWHIHQMDVKKAPRFRMEVNKSTICRLKKTLYGLKQALRAWNSKIIQYLHKIRFKTS